MVFENNSKEFAKRIVGMMVDYKITMFDALLWDFEYFTVEPADELYADRGVKYLEKCFRSYLAKCKVVDKKDADFYANIFMGRSNNMGLVKNAEAKNQ